MKRSFRKFAAAVSSLAVSASMLTGSLMPYASNAAYGVGGNGNAIMEYLDRGIYAIKSGDGMFVSWRYNANDDDDAEFRLYRDNELIYTSKSGEATNYWDASGNSNSKYRVDTLRNGEVINSEDCRFTSATNYFDVPLNVPKPLTMPDGSTCTYSPNDTAVGDVDGDGQYELIVKWDPSNSQDNSNNGVTGNVYVQGVVSSIANNGQFSSKYGNGTFWLSDDGTSNEFEAYRVLWLGNKKWVDGDDEIAVGDKVILHGQVTKYGTTYETSSGKAYVYSVNGKTE